MSPAHCAAESVEPGIREKGRTLSRPIDWAIPALLLVGGLLAGILATVLFEAADRGWLIALGGSAVVVGLAPAVGLLGTVAYMIALGAVGGYIGVDFAPGPVQERG